MSDRETTPKYWEVKKVYAPVKLEMEKDLQVFPKEQDVFLKEQDVLPKGLRVTNRNHHIGLEGYRCLWTLIENGKKIETRENWRCRWLPVKQERWLCPLMLRLINRLMFD